MEVSSSLLVAIMFITILSIGISNILMALPALVERPAGFEIGRLHLSWILLLLLMHLDLFWQVLLLLEREDWAFAGFVYTVTGPILLLLATSILLPDPGQAFDDSFSRFRAGARQAFVLLGLTMLWVLGMDAIFGSGLEWEGLWNVAAAGVFALVAQSTSAHVNAIGSGIAWAIFIGAGVARAFGALA
jgi:hypothetical protein